MATEKPNLPAPEEQVSPVAEDVQAAPETAADAVQPELSAPAETQADPAQPRPKRARIKPVAEPVETEADEDEAPANVEVDFSDEDAALAARSAGLELDEATAEEDAAERAAGEESSEDRFAGKSKEELVGLFARMLEEQPVQSIRRDVEALKAEQVKNLGLKTELCVATEELAAQPLTTRKEWNRASDRLLEIQKTWKTIGFAPKKDNNRIYERFRTACDRFFEAKRQFYAGVKAEMEHNLQLKLELCEAAESLSGSEEWKKATDELIALQARWKQIGAVARRHSDAVWKRFRAACDKFFERKSAHFASVDGEHEENLRRKLALLDEMEAADVKAGGYEVIRDFQRRWGEIGFVPIKQKDAVQKRYKAAVDALFSVLRGSERDRSMDRFREKVSTLKASGDRRLRSERERLYNKVRQLEQEIALLENNIGFFAKSKNAEALVADVRAKIDRARGEMAAAIEKVKLIDRQAQEEGGEPQKE